MKYLLASIIAFFTLVSVNTADAKSLPLPLPVHSWTGCYVGGNVGGAWASKSGSVTDYDNILTPNSIGSTTLSGLAYGGQVGCDYQFNNSWVIGIRALWDGSNMRGSNQWIRPGAPAGDVWTNNYNVNSFGTVVGKVGYLVNPTLELYGLGGLAWVEDKLSWAFSPGVGEFAAGDQARTGWDIGAGLSWMFAPNWDVFVEYDYMAFGTKNMSLPGVGAFAGFPYSANITQNVANVLVGVDYRFSSR
jgi:outer membrane immunogenic protein